MSAKARFRDYPNNSVSMRTAVVLGLSIFLLRWPAWSGTPAQDAVPVEILQRTEFIKKQDTEGGGAAFELDYHGKLYIVTAWHVVEGVPSSDAIIQVRRADKWEDYHIVKTLYPSSAAADIAVLRPPKRPHKHSISFRPKR